MAKVKYWDIDPGKQVRHRTDDEYAEHFSAVFKEAVRCRLRSNRRVGAELSGGLDSSAVVAVCQVLFREGKAPNRDFETFSLIFPGLSCDESAYIRDAIQMWHVGSNIVRDEEPQPSVYYEQARRYQDFPDYPNAVMSYPLMSLAREKGFRVLLTGGGGDEWLTGSYFHYADFLRRFDILSLIRQIRCDREFCRRADTVPAIIFPSLALLRLGLFPLLPPAIQRVVKWAVRRTGVPPWMQRQFAHRARLKERLRNGTSLRRFPTVAQAEIYRAITSGWACQGYELGSRSESRFGLEKRHPLSDRRIVEFALALPEEQRWRGEQPKFILRNAMRGLLPESIRLRLTKADFGHVFAKALKAIGGENFFNSLAIGSNEWVNGTELSALYRQMIRSYEGSSQELTPHTWKLWMASGIEVWFRTVFSDADSLSTEILSNQRANIQPVYS